MLRLDCPKERIVKDINEVLRRKKSQLEVLGKQIAQLQAAAEELRSIAHLLTDEESEQSHAAGR
jgi:prefoldin subunit 5